VALILLALALSCSSLTSVDTPDAISSTTAGSAAGAKGLWAGAVGTVYGVFASGSGLLAPDNTVNYGALLADELESGDIIGLNTSSIDARRLPDPEGGDRTFTVYSGLQRARVALRAALEANLQFAPTEATRIGQLYALLGYVNVWFAEYFCSGIPLSESRNGTIQYGVPLSTTELLQDAVSLFDSALGQAADSARIADLAHVGRARALIDLGNFAAAAAATSAVASDYRYTSEHSPAVQPNGIAAAFTSLRFGVANAKSGTGLDYRAAGDPRIPTSVVGLGSDRITNIYSLTGITAASPVVIASGVEARLIEAEAALQASDVSAFVADLNAARAAQGLSPLSDPGDSTARVDLLFRERAFAMFLTGHRLGDLRRLVRQYGRSVSDVFSGGIYKDGLLRGDAVNFSIPVSERNNPNFHGCLSRDP